MNPLVQQRLEDPQSVSDIELDVWYAINEMHAAGVFVLGYVKESDITLYQCKTDDHQRFCIEKTTILKHQIGEQIEKISSKDIQGVNLMYPLGENGLYSFDSYYNRFLPDDLNEQLAKPFDNKEIITNVSYYLVDEAGLFECHAVRYALQTKTSSQIILMKPVRDAFRQNYQQFYILPDELRSVPIRLFKEESNLERYHRDTPEWFCVPLDNERTTLNARFWGDKTWGDLLPDEREDASVGEIPLKYITLKTYVDGFHNIYVSVSDIQGNKKNVVLKINERTM